MAKKIAAALGAMSFLAIAGIAFAQPTVAPANQVADPIVINVNASGKVLLRGTVESVASGSITVKSWGGNWTINVPASAQIVPQGIALSSFKQGDVVGVQGAIDTGGSFTIDATLVRDWTQRQAVNQERQQNMQTVRATMQAGTPRNLQGALSNLSGQTFTLTSNGTKYAVTLATGAKVYQKNFLNFDYFQVQNGDTVRVWGTVASSSVSASIFRDLSVPR